MIKDKSVLNGILDGTKAETLSKLITLGFEVPKVYFFTVDEWNKSSEDCINEIQKQFKNEEFLAIRSSTIAEDSEVSSMAGAFESVLNVPSNDKFEIINAIKKVIDSYDNELSNQVLIQSMVVNVAMSGVAMTKVLDDGSPYYVINYDDSTGLTDTVTSGSRINKTVYIYNGVSEKDFDSKYLLQLITLIWKLEKEFNKVPLDIEFAINKSGVVFLLQVRRITTINSWNVKVNELVSNKIKFLGDYIDNIMKPRRGLAGQKTLLGLMPDWNPAEMIGVVPHPLSMSLYRELITRSTWRIAREQMGYKQMPNVELMVSLFGRVYIDVRNSINSFLPDGLDEHVENLLVDAFIQRLENNPHLHDKLEFEVVPTSYDFEFTEKFTERYPDLLDKEDYNKYKLLLLNLTNKAILNDNNSTLNLALNKIENLKAIQSEWDGKNYQNTLFYLTDKINTLLEECINYGTIPFAVIARHGFIAESFLRSAVSKNIITDDRVREFRRSIKTIAGELSEDFFNVSINNLDKKQFISKYGHLRPSSYDILSPNYENRFDIFDGSPHKPTVLPEFILTSNERSMLNEILLESGFKNVSADDLLLYSKKAIIGREYSKFIFTKHLSEILELINEWGQLQGFTRENMAMLEIDHIMRLLFSPLMNDTKEHYENIINESMQSFELASSFKLSYLIRSIRDIFIVPKQRSTPNFIGDHRIESEVILLTPYIKQTSDLKGKIVCIEGADPGYDWIFSREISGLITKYGGANSHMAIRCAEYNLPAAIGCGEQPFDRVINAGKCLLDCKGKRLEPLSFNL